MTNTPFQSLAYQKAWWTHLHPENGRLHTHAVRNEDKKLLAIACLYNLDGVLYFNGCVEEPDYTHRAGRSGLACHPGLLV